MKLERSVRRFLSRAALCTLVVGMLMPARPGADAIMRTQAMFAITICEISGEEGGMTVVFEVRPVGGAWKFVGVEIMEEERL